MPHDVPATAQDYLWFADLFPDLADGYCVTLVRDLSPAEVLDRLGADNRVSRTGVDSLIVPAFDAWLEHDGARPFIAATAVGAWTLTVEPNGFLGVSPEVSEILSVGTTVVSHYAGINASDDFWWLEDGRLMLMFEPLFPFLRSGAEADTLLDVLDRVGFDLRESADRCYDYPAEAAFALAEYITGVKLTPGLLLSAEFRCGTAPFQLPAPG